MAKKQNNYFNMFIEQVGYSHKAAENLLEVLQNFDVEKLPETMEFLHGIENEADQKKHDMMNKLAHEFITPIERDDIYDLAREIDDVTDSIEDVLLKICMFNIKTIRPEAIEMAKIIVQCSSALVEVMEEFHNFKKSTTIKDNIIKVNHLEEDGDKVYFDAVHKLYTTCKDPIEIMAWTATYAKLEQCCDNCEKVADVVEGVIMNNT